MTTSIVRRFLLAATAMLVAGAACAQAFPSRPIKIFVGYGAGGATDTLARFYATKLQDVLGTSVVIENKPGAQELLAALPVMNAPADGYTLWMGTGGALAQNPGVRHDLPYDLLKNFTPVAMVSEAEAIMFVRSDVPVNSLPELLAFGKANPGKLNYGSGGIGSGNHLQMEYLSSLTGTSFTHIPYKSDVEVTRDIMAGNVDIGMIISQFALPLIKEGKVKPIAVTGPQRLKELPNLPTFAEAGGAPLRTMGSYTFFGVMAPAGLPAPVLQRLNDAFNKVGAMPEVAQRMRDLVQRPSVASPGEFRAYLERELSKWREVGKTVKLATN